MITMTSKRNSAVDKLSTYSTPQGHVNCQQQKYIYPVHSENWVYTVSRSPSRACKREAIY